MITVTFVESIEQLVSGIPQTVEISTSQEATVYYTLDGTLPTPFSRVYSGPIEMPTDVGVVVLSAIAYYLDEDLNLVPSPILSETYFTDQTHLDRHRLMFFEGVVYIFPGGADIPYYYDGDGELVMSIDFPEEELDLVVSDRDHQGLPIDVTNAVTYIRPEESPSLLDETPPDFSSPNDIAAFNPEARMLLIDGRDGAAAEQIKLINGPFMSMRNHLGSFDGIEFFNLHGTNYISGSGTKMLVDRGRRVVVFYYFDSNSCRWVKSIQDLPATESLQLSGGYTPARVVPWLQWGKQSTI